MPPMIGEVCLIADGTRPHYAIWDGEEFVVQGTVEAWMCGPKTTVNEDLKPRKTMLKTALQAAVLVAATGTAVTTVPFIRGLWEPSDLERLQNKLEEVQAEVKLLDLEKDLRAKTVEVEARRKACEAVVEKAREKYPDAVAFFEANAASIFETAELVKSLER